LDITQKGLDLLIEAFAQVAQQIKFDLHIAGAGTSEDQQKLKSMINEHKLTKRVKLLGKLNSQAKADAFENAEFLVLPSRYEGQGITFLEGIAYDKVIVCFDIADMSWLSSKIAEKCSAFSVSELATAIKRLASDPVYKNQKLVALKAQKGQYIFNWDKITDKYTQLLNAKKEKNKEGNTYDN
jgi:glycosyltransferase involved in cell wall biosynthesis